ncbi:ABC transporter ATP-binding protein [Candidatus Galacturonibacter soehngenii]|uniref:ABC transporter ATP-binding protein n=1 Tax=Candidatus Galacturonatibacter soehngenii TaxID=2307010 RepID=A0A7V7QIJ2_9FIRM|nr:ABC transporter ATP-binding protein [Candidatus Galacturonibacter soehngenii]KAB1435980.1 ABC transporter ATP-binding protein [Candidatus Galacturonibacter soehngenii]MBA4686284.1 ABC transporter ATP-binding protein [Candidatus Galacturonibacter soehngenii]
MSKIIMSNRLIKAFGKEEEKRNVLNDVSVSIEEGEFVSVMGPSGSGKSTLMFCLSGMDTVDSGSIQFDGEDLTKQEEQKLSDIRRTKMGFVFQQPTLLKNLNIFDNIILPSIHENKKNKAVIIERAKLLMKQTGIEALTKRNIKQASGGQLQRAGICRALMGNPKIIFGDEPTGSLDSKSAQEIMKLFSKISKDGTTILLVTHDAKVAAQTERVLFMSDGKIVNEMHLMKYNGANLEERVSKITEQMKMIGM